MSRPVSSHAATHGDAERAFHESQPQIAVSRQASYRHNDNTGVSGVDHAPGAPHDHSVLSQSGGEPEHEVSDLQGNDPQSQTYVPSRHNTLKKRQSVSKGLRRSGSRRSSYAGSVKSTKLGEKERYEETPESNSVFSCPVPTHGSPTELLADRFQGKAVSIPQRAMD